MHTHTDQQSVYIHKQAFVPLSKTYRIYICIQKREKPNNDTNVSYTHTQSNPNIREDA